MANLDPILQCDACGAKLKLRASTLKIVKQVRCVKCQAMLEIPQILKEGGEISDVPILAKRVDASPAPVAVPPVPVIMSSASVAALPKIVSTPSAPVPATPVTAASGSGPATVSPVTIVPSSPAARPAEPVLVASLPEGLSQIARIEAMELKLATQQQSLETLTTQVRLLVRLQAEAANTCLAGLAK